MTVLFRFYTFIILLVGTLSKTESILVFFFFVLPFIIYSPESFPEEWLSPGALNAPGMAVGEAAGRVCLTVTSDEIHVCDTVSHQLGGCAALVYKEENKSELNSQMGV